MKIAAACLLVAFGLLAAPATLQVFAHAWAVPDAADWRIEQQEGAEVLHLAIPRGPASGPRRPIHFALANTPTFKQVTLEADVEPLGRSLMLVYAYQDASHFNYAHLSIDTAEVQPVHNGIFHVFGGERVRISTLGGAAAFAGSNRWYHVVLQADGATGRVDVSVDGATLPSLHAVDLSLTRGKVGLGSFDETANFKNVRIVGAFDSL